MTTRQRQRTREAVPADQPKSQKQHVEDVADGGYFTRKPIKLFGTTYMPGDVIPADVVDRLPRPESLIRAGFATRG